MLLKRGAKVNAHDSSRGRTPLHCAVGRRNIQAVKLLLEHGADVNVADKLGWTFSRSASVLCDHEVVKLLSKYGAKSVKYYLLVDFTTYMQHTRYRIRDMMQDIFCLGWASPSWASLGTKSARVSEVVLWSRDGIFKAW